MTIKGGFVWLTPTAAGTSQAFASLSIPQERFEAFPFTELDGPRIELSHFVLVGHPLIDWMG